MNVVEPILLQCRYNPPAPAICAPGTEFQLVSYARLERFIHSASHCAFEAGLRRGETVAVFVSDPVLHAVIVFGLMRLGIVTLSGRNPELPKEVKLDALIADSDFPYRAPRIIRADANWVRLDKGELAEKHIPATNPEDICRIVVTSGTTGDAKAIAVSHRMMADRCMRRLIYYGEALMRCSRTFCAPGLASSIGIQVLLFVLWRGGTLFAPGNDTEQLMRAFVDFQAENMVTAPATLASLLEHYEGSAAVKHRWKTVLVGGSPLTPALADRVRRHMCPHIVNIYGTSETGMIASAPYQLLAGIPGAVGYVVPGMAVETVDDADNRLAAGVEGTLRVRGPSDAKGYIGDSEQSRLAFRNGWFYPGDVGSLGEDRVLRISGRVKPVVNLGGDKVKPEMVEDVIASFEGIRQAAVFGVINSLGIEELCAAVVPRSTWNEDDLRAHCAGKLPPEFIPARFVILDDLPLNEFGKVDRRILPEIARAKPE
jgi:acyl-CoA synthetase (AMP-forming)/AMP-acid ligase II